MVQIRGCTLNGVDRSIRCGRNGKRHQNNRGRHYGITKNRAFADKNLHNQNTGNTMAQCNLTSGVILEKALLLPMFSERPTGGGISKW
jgi:hypothetical protein